MLFLLGVQLHITARGPGAERPVPVATGTVLLGDKQEADKYKQYNAGHVPDLIKPGDSAWGTDWLGESKVPSPLRAILRP